MALKNALERAGQPIGANDLMIAAHALALGHTVVIDNERESSNAGHFGLRTGLGQVERTSRPDRCLAYLRDVKQGRDAQSYPQGDRAESVRLM